MSPNPKKTAAKVLSTYELMKIFPDEQSAINYLAKILWADGIQCPYCEGKDITPRKSIPNFHRCNSCREDFSIRVGTIFERSHIPLHKWLNVDAPFLGHTLECLLDGYSKSGRLL
jgi:transposase-like protein